ncbi:class I SAM-dependent methyltransferase [Halomonas sediminis]
MSLVNHYQQYLSVEDVLDRVAEHYPAGASYYQLAPLDQLHIGGLKASQRLLNLLNTDTHPRVLDVGAGVGGLMRQAAQQGFTLVGLDITHAFNRLNQGLSRQLGLEHQLHAITGNAMALPFISSSFDAVLFQHSFLNMPDTTKVLAECRRVLRPGGVVVMHEVVSGPNVVSLRYPVPWASDPQHSCLMPTAMLLEKMRKAGFHLDHVEDWSADALAWRQRQREKETLSTQHDSQTKPAPALSPQLIFGQRFMEMGKNLVKNLADEAIQVVEIKASC